MQSICQTHNVLDFLDTPHHNCRQDICEHQQRNSKIKSVIKLQFYYIYKNNSKSSLHEIAHGIYCW